MVQKSTIPPSWDDLAAVLAVARAHSVRVAAEAMGVSHSTLARRIQAAEAALGSTVFIRSSSGFALTAVGERLVKHLARMEEEADAATRAAAGNDLLPRGQVRISIPPTLLGACIARHLPEFHDTYPQLRLDFATQFGFANLDRHEADVAVRYQERPEDHLVGVMAGVSMESAYAALDVVAALAAGKRPALIGWASSPAFLKRAARLGLEQHEIAFTCPDLDGQLALAEAGLGIAIMPHAVGDSSSRVHKIAELGSFEASKVWVLTHPDLRHSIRVKTVTAFLTKALKQALG